MLCDMLYKYNGTDKRNNNPILKKMLCIDLYKS